MRNLKQLPTTDAKENNTHRHKLRVTSSNLTLHDQSRNRKTHMYLCTHVYIRINPSCHVLGTGRQGISPRSIMVIGIDWDQLLLITPFSAGKMPADLAGCLQMSVCRGERQTVPADVCVCRGRWQTSTRGDEKTARPRPPNG